MSTALERLSCDFAGHDIDVPVIPRWWAEGMSYAEFAEELPRRALGRGCAMAARTLEENRCPPAARGQD